MRISLLVILFTVVSCGKEVKLTNGLEKSSLTAPTLSSGVLLRKANAGGTDKLQANGSSYNISMYSSYNALEFIAAKPMGSSINVQYRGTSGSDGMRLEEIK